MSEQTNLAADRLRTLMEENGWAVADDLDEALATARQQGREEAVQRIRTEVGPEFDDPHSCHATQTLAGTRAILDAIAGDSTNVPSAEHGGDRP